MEGKLPRHEYKQETEVKDYAVNVRFKLCLSQGRGGTPACRFYKGDCFKVCAYRNVYRHNQNNRFTSDDNPPNIAICAREEADFGYPNTKKFFIKEKVGEGWFLGQESTKNTQ